MRCAVFTTIPPGSYSGGRYHAVMIAEALAHGGHETHLAVNHVPAFWNDFSLFPNHHNVQLSLTKDFATGLPKGGFDVVVLVPGMPMAAVFCYGAQQFAVDRGAYLVFLNFESGNWFNALSPERRDIRLWDPWKRVAKRASVVLSLTKEGDRWAREFYRGCPRETRFDYCYPTINTPVADAVENAQREKRVVMFARFTMGAHKGCNRLDEVLCEPMRGHTLVLIVGMGSVDSEVIGRLRQRAREFGVSVEIREKLTDWQKFTELKRARLMLFPSFFEGFGYPPIEAQYCGLPCVAFDLPVLRETSGNRIFYAEAGNWAEFRAKVEEALTANLNYDHLHEAVRDTAGLDAHAAKLNEILAPLVQAGPPRGMHRRVWGWRLRYEGCCGKDLLKARLKARLKAARDYLNRKSAALVRRHR